MKGFLNKEQIDYILFHFNLACELNEDIKSKILFIKDKEDISNITNKLIFRLTSSPLYFDKIKTINEIPVLFPINNIPLFYFAENSNIVFNDDILKSCFYLLSGYQEMISQEKDKKNRFPYKESIQYKLGITCKPIVNYYFDAIYEGIKIYCDQNKIEFKKRKLFNRFGFVLSHDIDWIDKYDWNYIGYKIKELIGISPTKLNKIQLLKLLFKSVAGYFHLLKNNNPYWNFEFLQETENKFRFKSVYFFLPKNQKHVDAYYELDDSRLQQLYAFIQENGNEIGLHGTVESAGSKNAMKEGRESLIRATDFKIKGVRQHRLSFNYPETFLIMEENGLQYDSSLGFAEHIGFRNSFCLPFRPFDFVNNRMIDIWEIPLNAMDVSMFYYMGLSYEQCIQRIKDLIDEIIKFNGIFTLLWHNSFFDEIEYKGITEFYVKILQCIFSKKAESFCYSNVIQRLYDF